MTETVDRHGRVVDEGPVTRGAGEIVTLSAYPWQIDGELAKMIDTVITAATQQTPATDTTAPPARPRRAVPRSRPPAKRKTKGR